MSARNTDRDDPFRCTFPTRKASVVQDYLPTPSPVFFQANDPPLPFCLEIRNRVNHIDDVNRLSTDPISAFVFIVSLEK